MRLPCESQSWWHGSLGTECKFPHPDTLAIGVMVELPNKENAP